MFETRKWFEIAKPFTVITHRSCEDDRRLKRQKVKARTLHFQSNPTKKMRFTSSSEKDPSSTTFDEVTKSTGGINTMSCLVKRKIQKIKPVVEYNKSGRPHGKAAIEMHSYIGVLARTRVPLVDKKWTQLLKDLNEQIWEAVQMAYVVGEGGKKMVLSSTAKKWKDFKYTLTRQFILPFANKKEKLKEPPQLYNFIEKSQWDTFVASRLSQDFEAVHSEQSQRREKCEYNHRLSRKGYVGLEDQLEETMPTKEIDRSLLWKKARADKQGNIPNPKVAEKVKLIDDLKKQVPEGTLTVSGSNDVLTLALGTPEHGGKVRGVGARVSPTQFFNLPRQHRVKFADKLEESVMEAVREETKKMEARAKQSVLEAVRAEREILLKQFSQLIPNLLGKTPTTPMTPMTPITPIPPIPPIPQLE
ncbi:hypothetical protein L3X38_017825 [Prunus dulcis]|uniref:Transposase, Ptta/En/Spm, plant n=1 Tax=Prunus dulcis TaxID=3755 RepID=A0AAD4W9M7_PRUDU|nr:hypothetical protein L3X38_017825 [Prunus dulcis]